MRLSFSFSWDFDGSLRYVAFTAGQDSVVPGDTNGQSDAFVLDRQSPAFDTFDTDGDGLANTFETRFGLNAASSSGSGRTRRGSGR